VETCFARPYQSKTVACQTDSEGILRSSHIRFHGFTCKANVVYIYMIIGQKPCKLHARSKGFVVSTKLSRPQESPRSPQESLVAPRGSQDYDPQGAATVCRNS
jgi:hypothetical protein